MKVIYSISSIILHFAEPVDINIDCVLLVFLFVSMTRKGQFKVLKIMFPGVGDCLQLEYNKPVFFKNKLSDRLMLYL